MKKKKVGFIVYKDFAMWQVALLLKFLRNHGFDIETLSIEGGPVSSDGGINVNTEVIGTKNADNYQLIMMPGAGGSIPEEMLGNEDLKTFLKSYEGLIAASCASSAFVGAAGRLNGKYTAMPHLKDHFSAYYSQGTYCDTNVVVSENLITARGYAHYEFMMAVLDELGVLEAEPRLKQLALKLSKNQ